MEFFVLLAIIMSTATALLAIAKFVSAEKLHFSTRVVMLIAGFLMLTSAYGISDPSIVVYTYGVSASGIIGMFLLEEAVIGCVLSFNGHVTKDAVLKAAGFLTAIVGMMAILSTLFF